MADVENNVETKTEKERGGFFFLDFVAQFWQFALKTAELILCAICIAVVFAPLSSLLSRSRLEGNRLHHVGLLYTSLAGYIVINGALLLGRCLGDRIPYKTCTIFSASGAILHLSTMCVLASDVMYFEKQRWLDGDGHQMMVAGIALAAVNSMLFALDGVVTFIRRADF